MPEPHPQQPPRQLPANLAISQTRPPLWRMPNHPPLASLTTKQPRASPTAYLSPRAKPAAPSVVPRLSPRPLPLPGAPQPPMSHLPPSPRAANVLSPTELHRPKQQGLTPPVMSPRSTPFGTFRGIPASSPRQAHGAPATLANLAVPLSPAAAHAKSSTVSPRGTVSPRQVASVGTRGKASSSSGIFGSLPAKTMSIVNLLCSPRTPRVPNFTWEENENVAPFAALSLRDAQAPRERRAANHDAAHLHSLPPPHQRPAGTPRASMFADAVHASASDVQSQLHPHAVITTSTTRAISDVPEIHPYSIQQQFHESGKITKINHPTEHLGAQHAYWFNFAAMSFGKRSHKPAADTHPDCFPAHGTAHPAETRPPLQRQLSAQVAESRCLRLNEGVAPLPLKTGFGQSSRSKLVVATSAPDEQSFLASKKRLLSPSCYTMERTKSNRVEEHCVPDENLPAELIAQPVVDNVICKPGGAQRERSGSPSKQDSTSSASGNEGNDQHLGSQNNTTPSNQPRKRWSPEEDALLLELVKKSGPSGWDKYAVHFPGRSGRQVRLRWMNHLRPDLDHTPWTPEEDEFIIEAQKKYGNMWVQIAQLMPGRSDNAIKNRFHTLSRRQSKASLSEAEK